MKKDILYSFSMGLLLFSVFILTLGLISPTTLETINTDIIMTALSIYILLMTLGQLLYKKLKLKKETDNYNSNEKTRCQNLLDDFMEACTRLIVIFSIGLTMVIMMFVIFLLQDYIEVVSTISTLLTMATFFYYLASFED